MQAAYAESPGSGLRPALTAGALGLLLMTAFIVALQAQTKTRTPVAEAEPGVQVIYRDHAVEKHKGEALATRAACSDGVYRRYRSRSPYEQNTFYDVCRLPDGRYGLRIIRALCRVAETGAVVVEEATSFIPGYGPTKGTWATMKAYVTARATPYRWPLSGRFSQLSLRACN
jgi:hypothetical protein